MIDLEKKIDSYLSKVKTYIADRIDTYENSECKKKLAMRIHRLDDSIDMRFSTKGSNVHAVNQWKTKFAIPLVREAFIARRAVTLASFRGDPLVTVEPTKNTPVQNADNIQRLLAENWKATKFRQKAFLQITNMCARWGTGLMIPKFVSSERVYRKTQMGTFGWERPWMYEPQNNVLNSTLHPLNYFQDPHESDPESSSYRGYFQRRRLSEYIAEVAQNSDRYIKKELKAMIKEAKESAIKNERYMDDKAIKDYDGVGVDVTYWYGKVNIKGNETSEICYYAEMVGDHLVRFEENPYDENIVPIISWNYDKRLNYWWGNIDSETVIPHENFMHLLMQISADDALKKMERFVFYNEGMVDVADINNRHKLGGWVPFNASNGQTARDIFFDYQGQNTNIMNGVQYLMQEAKESAQRVRPKADLSRQGLPGGPRNDTATAAIMLDEQGDMQENDLLTSFSYGLLDTAGINAILMMQFMPGIFELRPDPRKPVMEMNKMEIMGTYGYNYSSSLTKNKQVQANNLLNTLTFLQNMRGTGDPSWLNIDMPKIVRGWLKRVDLGQDVDDIYPTQTQMQQSQQMAQPMTGQSPFGQMPPMEQAQPPIQEMEIQNAI